MTAALASPPAAAPRSPRGVVVLGSTGSIGTSTLDVIRHHRGRFPVVGLAAHSRWRELLEQAREFAPPLVALTDEAAYRAARDADWPAGTELLFGPDALARMTRERAADVVVSAIVGAAGLDSTWEAVSAGKTVALANKESLVVAGPLVMARAKERGATIVPVDSEHSAIFQAIGGHPADAVAKVVLTASGGPFRGKTRDELASVTPADALRHPTWQMGPKITVDSATLMNKALEVIEARWLFDLAPHQIDAIVHPESLVHSLVEFIDGSVLAQLSPPDMRLPIQLALTFPERWPGPARKLDWSALRGLTFAPPDRETFPALDLGFEVAAKGGSCGAVLNAANEVAVARFLAGELPFLGIADACRAALDRHDYSPRPTLDELHRLDRRSRDEVHRWLCQTHPTNTPPA